MIEEWTNPFRRPWGIEEERQLARDAATGLLYGSARPGEVAQTMVSASELAKYRQIISRLGA